MHTIRNKLFSAAAVFAIAMVVGAWTTSTRGGGEEMVLDIELHIDGFDGSSLPTFKAGELCIGGSTLSGQSGMVSWDWSSTFHFNGNTRQVQENLGFNDGWQFLDAVDDVDDDSDSAWIDVEENGAECEG
jgi:hypothetical protein